MELERMILMSLAVTIALLIPIAKAMRFYLFGFVGLNARFIAIGNPFVNAKEIDEVIGTGSWENALERAGSKYWEISQSADLAELDRRLEASETALVDDAFRGYPKQLSPYLGSELGRREVFHVKKVIAAIGTEAGAIDVPLPGHIPEEVVEEIKTSETGEGAVRAYLLWREGAIDPVLDEALTACEGSLSDIEMFLDSYILWTGLRSVDRLPLFVRRAVRGFALVRIDLHNLKQALRVRALISGKDRTFTDEDILSQFWWGLASDEGKGKAPARKKGRKKGRFDGFPALEGHYLSAWMLRQIASAEEAKEIIELLDGSPYAEEIVESLEAEDLGRVEKDLDTYLLNYAVKLHFDKFSNVGPLLRFLHSREMERRNITAVMQGIRAGSSADEIRRHCITEGAS